MDAAAHTRSTTPGNPALTELCHAIFDPLPRSDQRRWASVYVKGLVTVPGRKSIRRIAAQVDGRSAEQSLQQFVNQSPWDWAPVRQALARTVEAVATPCAWVVDGVEFPKHGASSVGVAVQYVPAARRAVNCQLAMATWLVGEAGSVPVNWRLMLPRCWDGDPDRRRKAHVPDREVHRPEWEHVLCSVDEMIEAWDLEPQPVVADRRHDRDVDPLVRGLEQRGLCFALRITDRTPIARPAIRSAPVPAGELMRSAARELITLPAPGPGRAGAGRTSSMLAQAAVPGRMCGGSGLLPERPRRLVARWPHGRSAPGQLWLTNVGAGRLVDLLDGVDAAGRAAREVDVLRTRSGLDHFEGRSFRGWHHHVTLASVAHAHRVLHAPVARAA